MEIPKFLQEKIFPGKDRDDCLRAQKWITDNLSKTPALIKEVNALEKRIKEIEEKNGSGKITDRRR